MSDYDDRREIIEHKKIARGQKDLSKKCHCGLVRSHHTIQQANMCKKQQKESTVMTRLSDKDIQNAEFRKI